jgi:PAS domain-containing protein
MSTSPDFAEPRTDQTAGHAAAPHHAETNGNRYHDIVDAKGRSTERRRRPSPSTPVECIHALPALILLDRLPIPMLATGLDGVLVYTNPAFATMLGYHPDTITLTGQPLPGLLAGYSATAPRDCVTALRAARTVVVDWLHAEGFPVRSVISDSLLVRGTDQIVLIGVTDITERMWTNPTQTR